MNRIGVKDNMMRKDLNMHFIENQNERVHFIINDAGGGGYSGFVGFVVAGLESTCPVVHDNFPGKDWNG